LDAEEKINVLESDGSKKEADPICGEVVIEEGDQ
jgi:hypothetical protein